MPQLRFSDVSGRSLSTDLPDTAKFSDACHYLATSLHLQDHQVRILNLDPDCEDGFHASGSSIFSQPPHPSFFYFQIVCKPPSPSPNPPSERLFEVLSQSSSERAEHRRYARMIRARPPDLDDRLTILIEMGFDRDKCEEAFLRARGDINRAAAILADAGSRRRSLGIPWLADDPEIHNRGRRFGTARRAMNSDLRALAHRLRRTARENLHLTEHWEDDAPRWSRRIGQLMELPPIDEPGDFRER
jgi:hypothetical protein